MAPDTQLMAAAVRATEGAISARKPVPLLRARLAAGTDIAAAGYNASPNYAVARDGRFLLNVSASEAIATSPISLVLNWAAALAGR